MASVGTRRHDSCCVGYSLVTIKKPGAPLYINTKSNASSTAVHLSLPPPSKPRPPNLDSLPPRHFPQVLPQNLPTRRLRHRLHPNHPAPQLLIRRRVLLHELLDLLFCNLRFLNNNDIRPRQLIPAPVRVRDAYHGRVCDQWMRQEEGF